MKAEAACSGADTVAVSVMVSEMVILPQTVPQQVSAGILVA